MGKKKAGRVIAAIGDPSKQYSLGPQPDKSVVLRVPDDFHLQVLRKAVERLQKNAAAARGTISALTDSEDVLIENVDRACNALKNIINRSRAPENQIADTPIGQELALATRAAVAGEKPERVAGRDDGMVWAPHVPTPRPSVGDTVAFVDRSETLITSVEGWDPDAQAFDVGTAENDGARKHLVLAHTYASGEYHWRVQDSLYDSATVPPAIGDELLAAAAAGGAADDDGAGSDWDPDAAGERKDAEIDTRPSGSKVRSIGSGKPPRVRRASALKPLPPAKAAGRGKKKGRR